MLDSLGKSWVHYKESQSKGKNLEDDMQAVVLKFGIVDSFYLQILFNSSMTFKIKKYRQWKEMNFCSTCNFTENVEFHQWIGDRYSGLCLGYFLSFQHKVATVSRFEYKVIWPKQFPELPIFSIRNFPHLTHAIVSEFNVSFRVQQHVVQFQISINYPSFMKII